MGTTYKISRAIIEPYENLAASAFREQYYNNTGKILMMINPDYKEGYSNPNEKYIPAQGNKFGGIIDENGEFQKVLLNSDTENAFQHAYLAAYIAFEKGNEAVEAFGLLKEFGTLFFLNDQDWGDHNRDFKNNNIGIQIADTIKQNNGTLNDLNLLMYNTVMNGGLVSTADMTDLCDEVIDLMNPAAKNRLLNNLVDSIEYLFTNDLIYYAMDLWSKNNQTFFDICRKMLDIVYDSRDIDMSEDMINDLHSQYNGYRGKFWDDNYQEKFHKAEGSECTPKDPIIFDLNNDGVLETTTVNNGVYFDHENDGFAEASAWVGENDGVLVIDTNNNGKIDNGTEVLLHSTLAAFDTNNDGIIDANDADFNNLKILKGDGTLMSLAEAGIISINLNTTATNITDENGNNQFASGTFTKSDGTTGTFGEFLVSTDTTNSMATEWLEETAEIAELPDISGNGNIYSLHQAMRHVA